MSNRCPVILALVIPTYLAALGCSAPKGDAEGTAQQAQTGASWEGTTPKVVGSLVYEQTVDVTPLPEGAPSAYAFVGKKGDVPRILIQDREDGDGIFDSNWKRAPKKLASDGTYYAVVSGYAPFHLKVTRIPEAPASFQIPGYKSGQEGTVMLNCVTTRFPAAGCLDEVGLVRKVESYTIAASAPMTISDGSNGAHWISFGAWDLTGYGYELLHDFNGPSLGAMLDLKGPHAPAGFLEKTERKFEWRATRVHGSDVLDSELRLVPFSDVSLTVSYYARRTEDFTCSGGVVTVKDMSVLTCEGVFRY